MAQKKTKDYRKLVCLIVLSYMAILFFWGIFGDMGLLKNIKLYRQNELIKTHISAFEAENKKLKIEADNLLSNPRFIEKIARDELNMSRSDEITLIFPDEETNTTETAKGSK